MSASVLGTRENPIKMNCADIKNSNEKIDEFVIRVVQRKLGSQGNVLKETGGIKILHLW